jgi:hypothetical protein
MAFFAMTIILFSYFSLLGYFLISHNDFHFLDLAQKGSSENHYEKSENNLTRKNKKIK